MKLKVQWIKTNIFIFVVMALSIFLRIMVPPTIVVNSPNDDYLGVMLAHSLIHGHWLGAWTPDLLSKPPAYAFYLAIVHFLRVTPTIPMHLLYLMASYFAISSILNVTHIDARVKVNLKKIFFLLFAFNPAVFAGDFSKIYRISLSTVLVIFYFGLMLELAKRTDTFLNSNSSPNSPTSPKAIIRSYWKLSVALGLLYATSVLNRIESYWILIPTSFFLVTVMTKGLLTTSRNSRPEIFRAIVLYRTKLFAILILISTISYLIPIQAIGFINKSVYGVDEIENYYSGNFAKAIKLWESVQTGRSQLSFVAVSKGQRAAIYPFSPTALKMAPVLDSPPNTGWKTFNCGMTKVCDESGIWFPWELRSAAMKTGEIQNEKDFQAFFSKLSSEIDAACKTHRVTCGRIGSGPGVKSVFDYPIHQIANGIFKSLLSILNFDQAANLSRSDSGQDPRQLQIWRETITFSYVTIPDDYSGWLAMNDAIRFLKAIYSPLIILLFAFLFGCLIYFWTRVRSLLRWYAVTSLVGMVVFSMGLSIVDAASGFTIGYSLYALPIQPLILIFITSIGVGLIEIFSQKD